MIEPLHYCEPGSKPHYRYTYGARLWLRLCVCRAHHRWPRRVQ